MGLGIETGWGTAIFGRRIGAAGFIMECDGCRRAWRKSACQTEHQIEPDEALARAGAVDLWKWGIPVFDGPQAQSGTWVL